LRMSSSFTLDTSLRVDLKRSASSSLPQSASRGARISGLPDSLPLRPARLFASLGGSDRVAPANRDFYFQAFDELVALFIAGYRYGSNWTISADGTFTHKSSSVIRCTRPVRAALPHPAPALGYNAKALPGIRVTDTNLRKPSSNMALHPIPRQASSLTTPFKHAPPDPTHCQSKVTDRGRIHGHRVVPHVARNHRAQVPTHLGNGLMPALPKCFFDLL
jgi:hypothetical protein